MPFQAIPSGPTSRAVLGTDRRHFTLEPPCVGIPVMETVILSKKEPKLGK